MQVHGRELQVPDVELRVQAAESQVQGRKALLQASGLANAGFRDGVVDVGDGGARSVTSRCKACG